MSEYTGRTTSSFWRKGSGLKHPIALFARGLSQEHVRQIAHEWPTSSQNDLNWIEYETRVKLYGHKQRRAPCQKNNLYRSSQRHMSSSSELHLSQHNAA